VDVHLGEHRVATGLGIVIAMAALVALVLWLRPPGTAAPLDPDGGPTPSGELPTAPLTGLPMEDALERPALLVKVSNSPEARPQTGLDAADVVFEELTEGGVTRFIAVFHSQLPDVVGPVRSARPVDVDVLGGFGRPGFAFSGARPEVRSLLAPAPAATITEGAPGFFRDDGTYASHPVAPHDLFLRVDEGMAAVVAGGAQPLGAIGWRFADDPPPGGTPGTTVVVPMSPWYPTTWTYDPGAEVYRRAQEDVPSVVTGDGRIGAANVVVLDVRQYVGASGYPETDVLGAGEAVILRDGQRYAARWSKATAGDPLTLLDEDGVPFELARGPTWILLPDQLPASTPGPASG
jgi:hypothetical protein